MFFLTRSKPGRLGAIRMGIEHGGFCVGCCWMLMAALFALGVMSIGWMAFIAALIAIEKLLPWRAVANRGIAVLLLVLGLSVAFVPERVPGLTLPDSSQATQAMDSMGMQP
jgi:predicted metal-binding membrane protein